MDSLATRGSAFMEAVDAFPLRRQEAFRTGTGTIHPGANFHVSPLHKTATTFSYHNVFYNESTAPGDKFDDVTAWRYQDQTSTSLYGGTQNAFGSFYTSQAYTPSFTCMAWSRSDRPGYQEVQAYRLHPVPGLPEVYISGQLNSLQYNSRPDGENTTITWKLVRYHTDDLNSNFEVLTAGTYLVKNIGTEVPVVLEGDYIIGTPPQEKGIFVRNFVSGSIALVVRNDYTEEIPSYGHVLVCDDIVYMMSPLIPYTRAVEDMSPLLVDPANGTVYSAVITPAFPHNIGAVWHTAKVVVGLGFETTFRFRISEMSRTCKTYAEPIKYCDYRGGDGFALVIHNSQDGETSLGDAGGGLGYSGIENGLAVEFDTWYNPDDGDPYQNHISVQTRGKDPLHHAHKYSMAATSDIGNLADGEIHTVRIVYQKNVDLASYITRSRIRQANDRFQTPIIAHRHAAMFMGKDSSTFRMGQLSIFLDDNPQAIMEVPLNLAAVLDLDTSGAYGSEDQMTKAWIGFTASTGTAFQRHEILDWHYTSTESTHPQAKRPQYCEYNTLPEDDDPVCHAQKLCSVDDIMESEHVGPNDPRNPRGAGHPGHYMSKYQRNCDKFGTAQDNTAPQLDMEPANRDVIRNHKGWAHLMPSDGGVSTVNRV